METKQVAVYLIIAGAVILALKFVTEIISFILSDFFDLLDIEKLSP